jgi:hypothetical protein
LTHKVIQCLINFSVDLESQKELVQLNVSGRIYDFLKENVQMDMKKADETTKAAFNQDEKVYEVK